MPLESTLSRKEIPILLRGEPDAINGWIRTWHVGRVTLYLLVIASGAACYGAAMGMWRDPVQAGYTAIKFPLVLVLTTFGNALLNGMLAPLLGLNIRFREAFLAILSSFTIAASILGAFSPLVVFLVLNTPPITARSFAGTSHAFILLTHVVVIAFAGIVANVRLIQILERLGGSKAVAWKILFAWLAANLFLGSQLSWILRPFIGSPGLPVEFLRSDAFNGNFYEAVLRAMQRLAS
jgi:hypothetical protein